MTRPARGRYTAPMRYLIAALALLPTIALADIAGPARVIDGNVGPAMPCPSAASLVYFTMIADREIWQAAQSCAVSNRPANRMAS